MRRGHWLLLLAVLVAGGCFWLRSGTRADYANIPPAARGDWVAFGDSLTEGIGASEGQDYPTRLGQRLGLKIRNSGVSGNTTADGLARLEQALQPAPRVVLLCLGGNDGLRSVPAEQTFTNLAAMIDRCHQTGAFVVLLGVRSVGLTDKNAKRFEQLAKTKRVLLVPNILDGILFDPRFMADQIHPNDQGYGKIVERLEKTLLPLLPQL